AATGTVRTTGWRAMKPQTRNSREAPRRPQAGAEDHADERFDRVAGDEVHDTGFHEDESAGGPRPLTDEAAPHAEGPDVEDPHAPDDAPRPYLPPTSAIPL